jgi:predicted ATPase
VLRERLAQVRQGQGQVVKTTLAADGFASIDCWGSPYAQHTALYPVIEWLQRGVHGDSNTPAPERLIRLEALVQQAGPDGHAGLPLLAALLGLHLPEARYPALQLTPQRQRQRTLETLGALLLGLATKQPVLLLVEDLHWLDPTTLEWLGMVLAQGPTAPLFTLLTCRPTFASPWGSRMHLTPLTLPRLLPQQVQQMVQWLGRGRLTPAQLQQIVRQTDGVPLFVEEVTKFVLAVCPWHNP